MPLIRSTGSTNLPGNEQIYATAFKLHFDSLYNYGLKITAKSDLVEDGIQEVFFRIWKNNIDLNAVSNLKSYLFKALRRQLLNMLELKSGLTTSLDIAANLGIEFSPEDFFIMNQTEEDNRKKILAALNSLPDRQREAIYLRYFEDLSFNEIAAIMNIHVQSAKNSVFRGLEIMKKSFPAIAFFNLLTQIK